MTAKIEKAIRDFHNRVGDIERVTDALNAVLMGHPESDFNMALWAVVGAYKDALDEAYSIGSWLEWWWLECSLGNNPMQAGLAGEELRTIATIDDLVTLVLDDLKQSEMEAA